MPCHRIFHSRGFYNCASTPVRAGGLVDEEARLEDAASALSIPVFSPHIGARGPFFGFRWARRELVVPSKWVDYPSCGVYPTALYISPCNSTELPYHFLCKTSLTCNVFI